MQQKKNHAYVAAAAVCAALLATGCSAPASEASAGGDQASVSTIEPNVLTVCTTFDNPPTSYYDEGRKESGVEIELAREVAKEMGLDVRFRETKFASIIPTLQAGQCDTIMGALYIKPEREEVIDFVPYLMSATAVAVPAKGTTEVTGLDGSLCGKLVGSQVSTTAEGFLVDQAAECEKEGAEPINLRRTDNGVAGLQQVVAGQLDGFADTSMALLYYQSTRPDAIRLVGEHVGEIEIGAGFNKDNPDLREAFAGAFATVQDSGRYEAILDEHNLGALAIGGNS
ncbi:ABC transporter substrate-binding protein [Arthrobacter mangrovi]|uniref:ABC transporter substrate-binding protein n=1 Tax=Arthrobacter mangrovi TaxID=2966350 RepID=A0ABQ5MWA4_9MICC|nr:ABC transporter substrate-binding protein [Arthrobacter mangrovi]GLB68262.1 ABC transporter substrate-binding protein [Arthrobacter mangrovi]